MVADFSFKFKTEREQGMFTGLIVSGSIVLGVCAVGIGAVAIAEGFRAFRETRERQQFYHPDAEAEREAIENLLGTRRTAFESRFHS